MKKLYGIFVIALFASLSQVVVAMERPVQAAAVQSPLQDFLTAVGMPASYQTFVTNKIEGSIVTRAVHTMGLALFMKTPEAQSEKGKRIVELKKEGIRLLAELEIAAILVDTKKMQSINDQFSRDGQELADLQK